MTVLAIKWQDDKLQVLDQLLLPAVTQYIDIKGIEDGWEVINKMQVRGAPAIALVGCMSLAVKIQNQEFDDKKSLCQTVENSMKFLISARPTAVNIKTAANELNTMMNKLCQDCSVTTVEMKQALLKTIHDMYTKDLNDNKKMGDHGAQEILKLSQPNKMVTVLTHCNTGSLATSGYGTALGVVRSLKKQNRLEKVYCTETRPYNQGSRLTAYEIVHDELPGTLVCDNMVAALMKSKKITAVVVGADRIVANGDTANKIGTYQIAVLAKYHNIPFYVAAPKTTIDFSLSDGNQIPLEERPEREMTQINGQQIAADGIKCWNPAFDVTPAELITGIVTEFGVYKPHDLDQLN